jgi:hypothetical protein
MVRCIHLSAIDESFEINCSGLSGQIVGLDFCDG